MLPAVDTVVIAQTLRMSTRILLEKLMEIERALRRGECWEARTLVIEAQDCVLELQRELMETLLENERLRRVA